MDISQYSKSKYNLNVDTLHMYFNSTLNALKEPIAILDSDYKFLALNSKYIQFFSDAYGVTADIGNNLILLLNHSPEDQIQTITLWSRALNGETCESSIKLTTPEGIKTCSISVSPLIDDSSRIIGAIQTITHISDVVEILNDNKRLKRKTIEQESKFRSALNSMLDGVIIYDPNGKIIFYNEQANNILLKYFDKKDRKTLVKHMQVEDEKGGKITVSNAAATRALKGESERNKKYKMILKNHPPIWLESSTAPIYIGDHQLAGVITNFRDITEKLRIKDRLGISETRFQTMADNISQLAWMADKTGSIFWYNKRWFEYTGTNLEDVKGWGWIKVIHPEHADRVAKHIKASWETGLKWEDISPIRSKSGEYRWFLLRAMPVYDENHEIVNWFGTHTDITDNKILEGKLQNERDLLRKIVDNIPVMIAIYDPELKEMYLNQAIEKITGWTNEDIKNHDIMDLAYPDPKYREEIKSYMKSLASGFKDVKMTCKDGTEIDTAWANIKVEDGRQTGIGIDMSAIKKFEKEQMQTNLELHQKNLYLKKYGELMENLLFMAAHDLRSPISNLQMMINLMSMETEPESKLEYLPNFSNMVKRLENVIAGLIEIIESQQIHEGLSIHPIHLETLLENIKTEFQDELNRYRGELTYNIKEIQAVNYVEPFLQSILKNLICNAIKYRKPQEKLKIAITIRKENGFILMSIQDNGIGFDIIKNAKDIFRPFKRFTNAASGTGIGLYIIKSFIEKNGGHVNVKSQPGIGTTFDCYLKEYTPSL